MTADELFREGRLSDAIALQNERVRSKPTDQDSRFLLFTLLCFGGELERAEKQLDVLVTQDERIQAGSLVFRSLLASEMERRLVYSGRSKPVLPPDAPAWSEARIEALSLVHRGEYADAERKLDEAIAATPAHSGKLDGVPFDGLRDTDDVLGSVLEVFAGGRYLWLPLDHIRRLEIRPPATALDTLWVPASLDDADGESAQVHLPVLYAGTADQEDEALRLGRRTEWLERGELYAGIGQRVLMTASDAGTAEHPLLEIRVLEIGDVSGDGA